MNIRRIVLDVDKAVSRPTLIEIRSAIEAVPDVQGLNLTVTWITTLSSRRSNPPERSSTALIRSLRANKSSKWCQGSDEVLLRVSSTPHLTPHGPWLGRWNPDGAHAGGWAVDGAWPRNAHGPWHKSRGRTSGFERICLLRRSLRAASWGPHPCGTAAQSDVPRSPRFDSLGAVRSGRGARDRGAVECCQFRGRAAPRLTGVLLPTFRWGPVVASRGSLGVLRVLWLGSSAAAIGYGTEV